MDVDQDRKLALISRDPRSYWGSTSRDPGEADPNGATNIAGVYVVDAKDPADLKLLTFQQLPTGHTTTCINGCRWLWTGGPASTTTQKQPPLSWTGGRPLIVTDLRDPRHPRGVPDAAGRPVPPRRRHRLLARRAGRRRGHRVGLRRRRHARLLDRRPALRPDRGARRARRRRSTRSRTAAAGCRSRSPTTPTAASSTTPGGRSARTRRAATSATARASSCWPPRRTSVRPRRAARSRACSASASLTDSYDGDAWRSTAGEPVPAEGGRHVEPVRARRAHARSAGRTTPDADFCSAHYFDVDGPVVSLRLVRRGHAVPGHLRSGEPAPVRVLAARRRHRLGLVPAPWLRLHGGPRARRRRPEVHEGRRVGSS